MSHYHSRAAFTSFGRTPDASPKPTTLTETGDRSPKGFGYVNTGTRLPNTPILLGGTDGNKWQQPGADDNRSQTEQARVGFMDMRKTQLVVEGERGMAAESRDNRQQAKLRLKESY